jgi:hypothetical protein
MQLNSQRKNVTPNPYNGKPRVLMTLPKKVLKTANGFDDFLDRLALQKERYGGFTISGRRVC